MQDQAITSPLPDPSPLTVRSGLLVCSGYGLRIRVERSHLVATDNHLGHRREVRLARAAAKLKRLVVLGHSGTVSLEALRWLHDVGAAFVQIDADARVVACFAPSGLDDPRLRRAQALAPANGRGLVIVRDLLRGKLEGQRGILGRLPATADAVHTIDQSLMAVSTAANFEELRSAEAAAAVAYWAAWCSGPVQFVRKDADRVPDHWRCFGARSSPLTGSPRNAANSANALLNYLYAVLETEARIAVLTMGLDPGLGILHADQRARDSLVHDLMEPVRPGVDAFVLELLRDRVFAAREFHETRTGTCRLVPPLPQLLAETAPRWAKAVAPIAEQAAGALFTDDRRRTQRQRQPVPTLLTGANRSAGRDASQGRSKAASPASRAPLPKACRECGVVLEQRQRSYCDQCLPGRMEDAVDAFLEAGPAALARLRDAGTDPAHGGVAARKRGARNAAHVAAAALWDETDGPPPDRDIFQRDILPGLLGVPLRAMAIATGLSEGYCSFVRRGQKVPHRRHWETLARLTHAAWGEEASELSQT